MTTTTATNTGKVVQVIGSTLDAEFDVLPAIYHALTMDITDPGTGVKTKLVAEVQQHLGRIFNVLGQVVDNGPDVSASCPRRPIHAKAPAFADLNPETEIFVTGIRLPAGRSPEFFATIV